MARDSLRRSSSSPICWRNPANICRSVPAAWSPVCRATSPTGAAGGPGRGDDVLDPRAQDLDGHYPAVVEAGCGPPRSTRPIGRGSNRSKASLSSIPRSDSTSGERRGAGGTGVQAGAELVGKASPNTPGGRGHHLAELHVGPAQVLEGAPQGLGQRATGRGTVADGAELARRGGREVGRRTTLAIVRPRRMSSRGASAPGSDAGRSSGRPRSAATVTGAGPATGVPTPRCRPGAASAAWGHPVRVGAGRATTHRGPKAATNTLSKEARAAL